MSNYSDYQKKGRSQGDSRYNKRPQGDQYSNRDSRNSERKYPENSNSYKGYNSGPYNDNYQPKGPRPYNPNGYKPKPHYPRNTYEEQHDTSQYRRKVTRYTKYDLLEGFENSTSMPNLHEMMNVFETIFTRDRLDPVNEEDFKLDPNDAFVPPRSNEPVPKKEEILGDNKFQMFDLSNQSYDPIAALKMQRQNKKEADGGQDDEFGGYNEGQNNFSEEDQGEFGEGDNFSDIDARFEQKLRSNQYHVTEDVFDELIGGTKKEFDLGELENDQRPDWEDEKVSTTIVEKEKDFFNQNPQLDKRSLLAPGTQVSKQVVFEESKQEPMDIKAQLQMFQKTIQQNQQTQQTPVVQQPVQQKSQLLLLNKPVQNQAPITTQSLLQQLQINPQAQQQQPQVQLQPQLLQKKADSDMDFSKLTFESDLRYEDDLDDNRQDEIFSAAFSQFSGSNAYSDNYENDISSFVKSLSSGVPTTFKTTSLLSKNLTTEVKPTVVEQPKTTVPEVQSNPQAPTTKCEPPKENSTTNIFGGPKKRPMPMYPSFIFRYYSNDYDQLNWYYIDVDEKKNGPFSGKSMDKWYADGTLPLELKVTIGENNQYKPIKEIADYIVAKTINGDGPPPEKKPKQQNEMISKLMNQLEGKDLKVSADHLPLKAKTLDEIEVPVNYEKWAPPMIKTEKKKDDKNHKNFNNRHNNDQGHNNYKKNYQYQNSRQNNQNYNQNYHQNHNQGGNFNNQEQNQNFANRNIVQRPYNANPQNIVNNNQPLIPNNLNISNPNDQALQIKGMLGMVKPEIKTQQQHQTQIQVNQVPKIDNADFPALGEN